MSAGINIRDFTGLTSDSRKVVKGGLFAALKGQNSDGRDFANQALQRGAIAILTDMRKCPATWPQNLQIFQVILIFYYLNLMYYLDFLYLLYLNYIFFL